MLKKMTEVYKLSFSWLIFQAVNKCEFILRVKLLKTKTLFLEKNDV